MFQQTTQEMIEPMLLSCRQTARLLNISERTLWTLTRRGDLPAVRIGRAVRYDPDDLRAWIDAAKTTPEAGVQP